MAATPAATVALTGPPAPQRRYWSPWRVLFLVGSAATLYLLLPKILDVLDRWTELQTISKPWFVVMLGFEIGSFFCMWWLIRVALPQADWFTAGTSQMAGRRGDQGRSRRGRHRRRAAVPDAGRQWGADGHGGLDDGRHLDRVHRDPVRPALPSP